MKKTILLIALVGIAVPSFAQSTLQEGFFTPNVNIITAVKRALFSAQHEKVEWVRAVRSKEHKADRNGPLGTSFYGIPSRKFNQQKSAETQNVLYTKRLANFQTKVAKNHTLSDYKFVVPNPKDLTSLSAGQVQFLTKFLEQPAEQNQFASAYLPKISHPMGAETELDFRVEGKILSLLINSRDKVVYLLDGATRHLAKNK